MAYVPSEYWVRIKVTKAGQHENSYYAAQALAREISQEHPGLTVEVAEDKVWVSCRTKEERHGSQELPGQESACAPRP